MQTIITVNVLKHFVHQMAYTNGADPDQTAPEGAVGSGSPLLAIPLSILRKDCIQSKI